MLSLIDRAGGLLAGLLTVLAALALFALVPLSGWLVFGRYILNSSPTWVEATSLVLVLVTTFGVAAAATRSEDHLSIGFVRESFPPPVERTLRFTSHMAMIVFGAFMAVASWSNVASTWSRPIPLLEIPEGVRHIPLVVGGAGIALFSAIHAVKMILGRDAPPPAEPTEGAG